MPLLEGWWYDHMNKLVEPDGFLDSVGGKSVENFCISLLGLSVFSYTMKTQKAVKQETLDVIKDDGIFWVFSVVLL